MRPGRPARALVAVLHLLSSTSVLAAPNPSPGPGTGSKADIGYDRPRLARIRAELEAMQRDGGGDRFDLDRRLVDLDLDPDRILGFVTREIRFEPYRGALRGPALTLAAGAGNSVDQAWLLAELLQRAGHEARLVRARLPAEQAAKVLEVAMAAAEIPPRTEIAGVAADPGALQKAMASRLGVAVDAAALASRLAARARQLADLGTQAAGSAAALEATLATSPGAMPSPDSGVLLEEVRDYTWVEHRIGPGSPWVAAHPTGAFEAASGPVADRVLGAVPPDEDRWVVSLQGVLEVEEGGTRSRVPLMDPWSCEARELATRSRALRIEPDGIRAASDLGDLGPALERTSRFTLTLGGQVPPGGKTFDRDGFPVARVPDAAAALGSLAGGISVAPGGALSGGAPRKDPTPGAPRRRIERILVRVESKGPGETRVHERDLYRSMDASRRPGGAELTGELRLVGLVADLPTRWHRHRSLVDARSAVDLAERVQEGDAGAAVELGRTLESTESPQVTQLVRALAIRPASATVRDYRGAPTLVLMGATLDAATRVVNRTVDVLQNPTRALARHQGSPVLARSAVRAAGVYESAHEGLAVSGTGAVSSAHRDLAAAGSLRLVDRPEAPEVLALPEPARRHALRDLAQGFRLVVASAGDRTAWWRTHPGTGETAAVTMQGTGGAAIETDIMILGIWSGVIGALFALLAVKGCNTLCCLGVAMMITLGVTVLGLGFGAAAVAAATTAGEAAANAAILTLLWDVGGGAASAALIPSPCNDPKKYH